MNYVIDTDMGIDDAMALLMILAHPQAKIKAITSVLGNVPLAQATHNTGVVLDLAKAPAIPIYRGCARPLLQYDPDNAVNVHGQDGLGGAGKAETTRTVEAEHASMALIRLARQNPGELTLLTLGPLTNVALAVRLDPDFPGNLKNLIIMGGAVDGRGNTTPPTEFNVGVDPEAAKIVCDACRKVPGGVWLIPWETSLTEAVPFSDWDLMIEGDSPIAQFLQQMTGHIKQVMAALSHPVSIWPDPLAAAVALAPGIITAEERRFIDVELGWGIARGQTIVDYRNSSDSSPNMNIVRGVDKHRFRELLRLAVH